MTRGRHPAIDVPDGNWMAGGPGTPRRYERTCATCSRTFWATSGQRFCQRACIRYATVEERFEAKVDRRGLDECWPWLGASDPLGYGTMRVERVAVGAHRMALELSLGRPLLPGMEACHTCDNPPCCNPAHLFEGTHADNMRDMGEKGRVGNQFIGSVVAR